MTALVLEPHADDAALFAAYTCCREAETGGCVIVTILAGDAVRDDESHWAARHLGCDYLPLIDQRTGLTIREGRPDWDAAVLSLREYAGRIDDLTVVYAPTVEDGGHDHHNRVGHLAAGLFGVDRVTGYTTYTRHGGRTVGVHEVVPDDPVWILRKLRALACYESQIADPATRPWFTGGLSEWYT